MNYKLDVAFWSGAGLTVLGLVLFNFVSWLGILLFVLGLIVLLVCDILAP